MEWKEAYLNKVYGGFLGKTVGVIHGANIESWTYEKIKAAYGTITGYPVQFENFCSDDDLNGPLFYMRALSDFGYDKEISVEKMAHTMLNYVGERHGFFWWGGYGISTEDTAYQNLVNGIKAPESGSAALNGIVMAEQIGGQIFSDCWGLVCPDDMTLAAELAGKMSGITHDKNGIYGGQFIAACIAGAFEESNPVRLIQKALTHIPKDCTYAKMANEVMEQSLLHGNDWEKTFFFVQKKYGYDSYPGVCHIIPNAAVIILSLVHGKGSFDDTLNICNMCGWDTDCNVGNIGTIMGVMIGADQIDKKWTTNIRDFVCASSVLGYLNIQTLSQAAALCVKITSKLYGISLPKQWEDILNHKEGMYFHFAFPTAIHAFRSRSPQTQPVLLENVKGEGREGSRCLSIKAPFAKRGDSFFIYHKTYYRPDDFQDSRYDPDFSPTVYPGDRICLQIRKKDALEGRIMLTPYVKNRLNGENCLLTEAACLLEKQKEFTKIEFHVPSTRNLLVEEIGFRVLCLSDMTSVPELYLDEMELISCPEYEYDFSAFFQEKWNTVHECPAHLTYLRGNVKLQDGKLEISGYGKPAEAFSGSIHWDNYEFSARLLPQKGDTHRILFRVQGAMRGYAAGLSKGGMALWKKEGDYKLLAMLSCEWQAEGEYTIKIKAKENVIAVFLDDMHVLTYIDEETPYLTGCVGFGNEEAAKTAFLEYKVNTIFSSPLL